MQYDWLVLYPNTPLKSTCAYIEFDKFKDKKKHNEGLYSDGWKFVCTRGIDRKNIIKHKNFIICSFHKVGALVSHIGTCTFERGIRVSEIIKRGTEKVKVKKPDKFIRAAYRSVSWSIWFYWIHGCTWKKLEKYIQ